MVGLILCVVFLPLAHEVVADILSVVVSPRFCLEAKVELLPLGRSIGLLHSEHVCSYHVLSFIALGAAHQLTPYGVPGPCATPGGGLAPKSFMAPSFEQSRKLVGPPAEPVNTWLPPVEVCRKLVGSRFWEPGNS